MNRTRNYRTLTVSIGHFERVKAAADAKGWPSSMLTEAALNLLFDSGKLDEMTGQPIPGYLDTRHAEAEAAKRPKRSR